MGTTKVSISRHLDKEEWYLYTRKCYSETHKKKEILLFVTTWMDLVGIMLSEISQRKTNTVRFLLTCEISKTTNKTKQK